jgi:hypothetical protein
MSKPRENAIHIAAQCWCDDRNAKTVMDPDLALSFAERLEEQMAKADKLAEALANVRKYNWYGFGPDGCDNHCIKHPCGPCRFEITLHGYIHKALKEYREE